MATRLSAIDFTPDLARLTEKFTGRQWVFDEIDRWLTEREERFFILTGEPGVGKSAIAAKLIQQRQAQQDLAAYHFCIARQISTIEPDNVLFSLAAQLINFFPDYAEALVNTIKPLHLSVDVEINIGTIKDSVVQGVVIENLHTQHPKKSFDIILRQTLSALPNPPEKPILILIDSLDEAVTYNEEDNLVRLFSQVDDLPSWVRLVFTSRLDERRVLSHFKTLKPYHYHLDELSKESLEDIHTYVDDRVKSTSVQEQLQKYKVASTDLVEQLTDLSKGNFLYTKVLLDDIASGGQPLDKENLAKLPKSLGDFYHTFLERRVEAEWEGKYQLIFKILTVTKAPITEDELANLVSETLLETELKQRLLVVQQFLDVTQNDWDKKTYTLFHQSLRDYLTDGEKSEVFYCSPKDGHRQIVDYYWQYQEDPRSWQECEAYGLQFLAPHLVDLAALEKPPVRGRKYIERLHELLATEVDGHNAWFVAKDRIGDTAGFLADVTLAWELAEQNWTEATLPQVIEKQCRYALILSSLNSLSDIPTELLEALVKAGTPYGWTLEQALAYTRQIPDASKRVKSLKILTDYLPEERREGMWKEALTAAQAIQNEPGRAAALISLATHIPQQLYEPMLIAAQAIQSRSNHAEVLISLAAHFPSACEPALAAALAIQDEDRCAQVLSKLAAHFPTACEPALAAAVAMSSWHQSLRAGVLSDLAAHLPQRLYERALVIAQTISDQYPRAQVLSALAARFPEAYEPALTAAQAINHAPDRVQVLSALAAQFPEAYELALTAAEEAISHWDGSEGDSCSWILNMLAVHVPPSFYEPTIAVAQTMLYGDERAWVLRTLAARFPEAYEPALTAAQAIQNEFERAKVLSALAVDFPAAYEPALAAAQAIQHESERAKVLSALAVDFPAAYEPALAAAQAIQHESERAKVLSKLAAHFPTACEPALAAAQAIQNESERAEVLSNLAAHFPTACKPALTVAQTIPDKDYRAQFLSALAVDFPAAYEPALAAAQAIQHESERAKVLSKLAAHFPTACEPALAAAQAIQHELERAQVLSKLAAHFPTACEPALAAAQAIQHELERAQVLIGLAAHFPTAYEPALAAAQANQDEVWNGKRIEHRRTQFLRALAVHFPAAYEPALAAAQAIGYSSPRVQALIDLAVHFPAAYEPALAAAQAINYKTDRAKFLSALAVHFPAAHGAALTAALAAVQATQDESPIWSPDGSEEPESTYRAKVLSDLAAHFPAVYEPALAAAQAIQNEFKRAQVLSKLAAHFPAVYEPALAAAQAIQNEFKRAQVLSKLAAHFPAVYEPALAAAQAIQDEFKRAWVLSELAAHFPAVYEPALAAAQAIQDESKRAWVLSKLMPRFSSFPLPIQFSIWQQFLRAAAQRKRPELLSDLNTSVSLIAKLGGEVGGIAIAETVQQVATWWK